MAFLIVETVHATPVTNEQVHEAGTKVGGCLDRRDMKWIKSYISEDRTKQICIFEGPDAESLRDAYRRAGVKFEKVWTAFAPM